MKTNKEEIDCDRFAVRMYDLLDGELTIKTEYRMQQHLNQCVECNKKYYFEKDIKNRLKRLNLIIDSESFKKRFRI